MLETMKELRLIAFFLAAWSIRFRRSAGMRTMTGLRPLSSLISSPVSVLPAPEIKSSALESLVANVLRLGFSAIVNVHLPNSEVISMRKP
jgi:hypothetical protein